MSAESVETMSLAEIQRKGLEALARELGPVGMIRFLQLFETGEGDYTAERLTRLGKQDLHEIIAEVRKSRSKE